MQNQKDKVEDKPPTDPHREYLDAPSTDEEEHRKIYEKNIKGFFCHLPTISPFHLSSLPTPCDFSNVRKSYFVDSVVGYEADVVQEELKPVYDEQELTDLINIVKDMTTLGGLEEVEWYYFNEVTIREFFENPSITTLTVYYLNNILTVSLFFPVIPVYELTYFIREPQEILRAETFRERILFGTMNSKVESYVLTVTQDVLAPIFVEIETWPDSILYSLYTLSLTRV
ncbi:hypothetical protein ANTPLA_LOCUS303 [Anthophora plagiata]